MKCDRASAQINDIAIFNINNFTMDLQAVDMFE